MTPSADIVLLLYLRFRRHPVVSTDSRRVTAGSMFFALRGGSFDGNRFAADALAKGAALAVVDDPAVIPADGSHLYILVDDVLSALQAMAAYHRRQLAIPILAITGSNGKTTTKELLSRVLAGRFRISVTQGNLNNHIGVPLTLLAMDAQTQFGIVEMGANAPGEIASLCGIAQPEYGLITNIGRAHLEGFGGVEGVVRAKGELYDWLSAHGGLAFYRADDPTLTSMISSHGTLRAMAYQSSDGDLPSRLEGDYNRENIAAAVAVGRHFGVPDAEIAAAVAGYTPDNNRSQRVETDRNTLILDCYNANPSSMAAALENFAVESVPGRSKAVILGDMLELGAWSDEEHRRVLGLLAGMELAEIFLVGTHFPAAASEVKGLPVKSFPDREALSSWLAQNPLSNRFILLKGSRGIGLEKVVGLL